MLHDLVELRVAHVRVDLGVGRAPARRSAGSSRRPSAGSRPGPRGAAAGPRAARPRRPGSRSSPRASRSTTSSWIASAICVQVSRRGWSSRTNDHCRIVTGPVSMPFTGLSVSDCAYCHQRTVIGSRPRDVAVEDRRLHAARAVGLHPAVLGEREPAQPLAEVLDHVVALGLAVHEHVEADVLLVGDHLGDRALQEALVVGRGLRARAARISGVCGNEPIVVVGSSGSASRARWASRRTSNGASRS